ncbi:MAG TPA: dienelactone hydrolase family protein [Thermoanaerobaculia bacterium]|nr:dienelactone hydrolase family protein [Thermoanaerobaculia bacterium]
MTPPPDYETFTFSYDGLEVPVFFRGKGPGVLLMHELPGMVKECLDLANRLVAEGFTVYLPLFFGQPGERSSSLLQLPRLCIRKEWRACAAGQTSPVVGWLRALARRIAQDRPGKVGAIGMCLTGGFVIPLILEPAVHAAVAGQPSIPIVFPWSSRATRADAGVAPKDLTAARARCQREGLQIFLLRFAEDRICPQERRETLRRELGSVLREPAVPITGKGHSVLAGDLSEDPGHPTRKALAEVIEYLKVNLGA